LLPYHQSRNREELAARDTDVGDARAGGWWFKEEGREERMGGEGEKVGEEKGEGGEKGKRGLGVQDLG